MSWWSCLLWWRRPSRQKLKEKLGFTITRINLDVQNFDLDVAIARICNYIKESSVKLNLAQNLAVNLAEKSLRETFPKRITEFMSSILNL